MAASNRAGLGARVLALAPPPPTGTVARPTNPSGALHTGGAVSLVLLARSPLPLAMSQVIPLRLFQNVNCIRWYFNVSECC